MKEALTLHPHLEKTLEQKRALLAALENELAERELELATAEAELRAFELRYLQVVGRRYAELDEIETRMAEITGQMDQARRAASDWDAADELSCGQTRFQAAERLKKLYRETARRFHPDLAADEHEREHRHQLMIEINRAYESGAEDRLQALLDAENAIAQTPALDGATELLVIEHRMERAQSRIAEIGSSVAAIEASEIFRLKQRADRAEAAGWDLLAELLSQVERQIEKSRHRLFHLEGVVRELAVD